MLLTGWTGCKKATYPNSDSGEINGLPNTAMVPHLDSCTTNGEKSKGFLRDGAVKSDRKRRYAMMGIHLSETRLRKSTQILSAFAKGRPANSSPREPLHVQASYTGYTTDIFV